MQQNRRKFLFKTAAGAAAVASGATGIFGAPWIRRAQAAEFTYKLGHDLPASHPLNKRLLEAAELIKRDTDGRLEIRLFPNNQLGGDPDMFAQMRSGALEIFASSGANTLSSLVPKTAIWTVGFAFKDYGQVFGALDGELGAYLRGLVNKAGLEVQQNVWDNGFRQITTGAKQVSSPADLKGMKFRVPPGRQWISLFSALGASPATISFNEVYLSLQSKLVEGQENALAIIDSAKLYEVQKHCSLTSHAWDGFWLVSNRQTWQKLPSSVRDIASKHLNAQALKEREDVAALNTSLQKSLEAKGMAFNAPDIQPFREMLRNSGYYSDMQKAFGAEEWGLLEKVTGRLA